MPATGTVPVVSNPVPEYRKNSKKRKLESSTTADSTDVPYTSEQDQPTTTPDLVHHGLASPGAAFPVALGERANYAPDQITKVSDNQSPVQHRDSLLVMNTPADASAKIDETAGGETSDETDEAELQGMSRMLDDGKGRMRTFELECPKI